MLKGTAGSCAKGTVFLVGVRDVDMLPPSPAFMSSAKEPSHIPRARRCSSSIDVRIRFRERCPSAVARPEARITGIRPLPAAASRLGCGAVLTAAGRRAVRQHPAERRDVAQRGALVSGALSAGARRTIIANEWTWMAAVTEF